MTYDLSDVIGWRAMDAIGRICATEPVDKVRNTIERILWTMREESGNNPWSSAEVIAEILTRNPDPFLDIVPIVISFNDEPIMRPGALRAMYRIGRDRPELVELFADAPIEHKDDPNPQVRGYAALALSFVAPQGRAEALRKLGSDDARFSFYDGVELREITVAEAARMALEEGQE